MLYPIDNLRWNNNLLKSWYPNFDKGLVKECYYVDGWNNYDCSGFLMVFMGIDGSYQVITGETNPYCDSDDLPMMIEVTEDWAKKYITNFDKTIKEVNESDCCYGV